MHFGKPVLETPDFLPENGLAPGPCRGLYPQPVQLTPQYLVNSAILKIKNNWGAGGGAYRIGELRYSKKCVVLGQAAGRHEREPGSVTRTGGSVNLISVLFRTNRRQPLPSRTRGEKPRRDQHRSSRGLMRHGLPHGRTHTDSREMANCAERGTAAGDTGERARRRRRDCKRGMLHVRDSLPGGSTSATGRGAVASRAEVEERMHTRRQDRPVCATALPARATASIPSPNGEKRGDGEALPMTCIRRCREC